MLKVSFNIDSEMKVNKKFYEMNKLPLLYILKYLYINISIKF